MNSRTNIIVGVILTSVVVLGLLTFGFLQPARSVESSPPRDITHTTNESTPEAALQSSRIKPKIQDSTHTKQPDSSTASPKQSKIKELGIDEKTYFTMAASADTYAEEDWKLDAIHSSGAWTRMTTEGSIVAVIDSGFALDHEDLANQWHINEEEQGTTQAGDTCWTGVAQNKQTNGCDDDNNGYVDDWRGWDFYTIDNDPSAGLENPSGDGVAHGTQVAGLVAAETNNTVGIASVGKHNSVMPLQVMSDSGIGYTSDIMAAVYYAVDNGAGVINMSLGGRDIDPYLQDALDYAEDNSVIVIAASGNCGNSTVDFCSGLPAGGITYPARYRNVIAVGAVTQTNQRASFSSYGNELDVVAPGSGTIISTNWTNTNQTNAYTGSLYGTSFASPIVASIAGILKAAQPAMDTQSMKAILVANAQKLPDMQGNYYTSTYGHGLVDAGIATQLALEIPTTLTEPVSLHQTGNYVAEHFYTLNSTTGSSCMVAPNNWCTVWLESTQGYDRYLPYKQTDENGTASWSWNTTPLGGYSWTSKAATGSFYSAGYTYIKK